MENRRRNSCFYHQRRFAPLLLLLTIMCHTSRTVGGFSSIAAPGDNSGDQVRLAKGIRPSMHPLTINAVSEALRQRSRQILIVKEGNQSQDEAVKIDTSVEGTTPMDVALAAAKIASDALAQRRIACEADGSLESDMYNLAECQCIAGRIVGVVTRFQLLEEALIGKVSVVPWVKKYNEFGSFGLSKIECEVEVNTQKGGSTSTTTATGTAEVILAELLDNPLLRMSRAECLLAMFLETVEKPKLQLLDKSEIMPDESLIDFIDADRAEVILEFM
jgi:hypothetical protein